MMLSSKKHYSGLTLVETLVSIAILTVAMGGFSLLFMRTFRTNAFILEEGNTAVRTSRVVEKIASDLRKINQGDDGSYPIVSGSDFDLVAYMDIDNDDVTERVHYYIDGDVLKRGVTDPNTGTPATYPSGDQVVTELADYVVNTASEPLFSYYNENYPGDSVNNPLTTPVSVADVRLIRIWVRMNVDPVRAPDNINIESFADLRNLENY